MQLSDWVTILQTEDKINHNTYFSPKTLQTNVSTKRHLEVFVAYNQKKLSTKLFLDVLKQFYFGNFYKFITNVYSVWSKLERKYHFPFILLNDLLSHSIFQNHLTLNFKRISPLKTPSKQTAKIIEYVCPSFKYFLRPWLKSWNNDKLFLAGYNRSSPKTELFHFSNNKKARSQTASNDLLTLAVE